MSVLAWVGLGCQVVGLALAALGLSDTWQQFGQGEPFLAPVWRVLARVRVRLVRLAAVVARRLGRRPPPQVVGMGATMSGVSTVSGRGEVRFGRLDKHDAIAAIRQLEMRTNALQDDLIRLHWRVVDGEEAATTQLATLEARLVAEVERLEAIDRKIAVGGVRLEAVGLGFVALGTLLQAIAG